MTPEVRTAARRTGLYIKNRGVLGKDGLTLWNEIGCEGWKAGPAEVARYLDTLGVTYQVRLVMRERSPWCGPTSKLPRKDWCNLFVADADLPKLATHLSATVRTWLATARNS